MVVFIPEASDLATGQPFTIMTVMILALVLSMETCLLHFEMKTRVRGKAYTINVHAQTLQHVCNINRNDCFERNSTALLKM